MSSTSPPTRIDAEVYERARAEAATMSRTLAQQISHWARLGMALEADRDVSASHVADVLHGRRPYDELTTHEQAVVRAEWDERMTTALTGLDLAADNAAAGRASARLGADGQVEVTGAPLAQPKVAAMAAGETTVKRRTRKSGPKRPAPTTG